MAMDIVQLKKRLVTRKKIMDGMRERRWPHWQAIGELVVPRTGRFDRDTNRSDREGDMNDAIINSAGTLAYRIMKSGMHTGLTSHTAPWFARRFRRPELNDWGPPKIWLEMQVKKLYAFFDKSTFYNLCPKYYGDAGLFGAGAMHMDANPAGGFTVYRHPIGTYSIANGIDGYADTCYSEEVLTVNNLIKKFGRQNVSERVLKMDANGQSEQRIEIVHAIEPNDERIPKRRDFMGMPWRAIYYEEKSNDNEILRISGYWEFPVFITIWDKDQDDVWGGGLGADALPDLRMAQKLESSLLEQIDKVADPAVNAPTSMRADGIHLNPGDTNWRADPNDPGVVPVLNITPAIEPLDAKIIRTEARINQHFFANLFEAINQSAMPGNRRDRTAFEVDVLEKEKLVQLIPALESFFRSFLAPAVDRAWNILDRQDLLDDPPPGIEKEELKTEFTSTLALAARLVQNIALNDGMTFAANLMEMDPTVVQRVNLDGALTTYFDNIGMPAKAVYSDDEYAEIQAAAAVAAAEKQNMEKVAAGAGAAKDLAAAEPTETNVLGQLLGASQAAA